MKHRSNKNSPRYKWIVMGIIIIGTLMTALDSSIVNVSIPAIMADFGANLDQIEWVITSYMISLAVSMPLIAWFRDHIGYRKLYIASLVVFTMGSLLCGIAWNIQTLIAARIIQALGGGAITPTGMAMISEVFPKSERGKAMGIWGMSVMVGPALGPTLGGYLTHALGWRSIFLVNLPIGIVGTIAAWRLLAVDTHMNSTKRPFDVWGFVFLSTFLITFLLGTSKGERLGWGSTTIIALFLTSAICFIGFLLVENNVPNGIIDIALFKSPVFALCAGTAAVRALVLYGGTFLLPIFVQQQMGYNEMQSGLIMMPGALAVAIIMPVGGKLGDKIGARIPTLAGLFCLGCFMFMYHDLNVNTPVIDVIIPTIIRGAGLALMMAPVTTAAMNAIPIYKMGMASSMLNVTQQIGGSIGIVLFGTVLTNRTHYHLSVVSETIHNNTAIFGSSLQDIMHRAHDIGFSYAQSAQIAQSFLIKRVSQAAVVVSFQDAFIVGGCVVIAAVIPSLFLPGKEPAHSITTDRIVKEEVLEEVSKID